VNIEHDWLAQRAELQPHRSALIAGSLYWTFAELDRRVSVVARRLVRLGVRPADRVALLLGNTPSMVEIVHAAPRTGAILVPLNTRLALAEHTWQLQDVGARLLIHDDTCRARAAALSRVLPDLPIVSTHRLAPAGPSERPPCPPLDPSAIHSIIYTSGTTGRPKGALLTHANHWWSAIGSERNLGVHPDDRWLAVLPLFHVGGLSILIRGVVSGMAVVLHESFDPAAVNRAIDEDGITIVSVVSTMLERMLEDRGERPYPWHLRCVLLGGGPVPSRLLDACTRRAVPVVQTYGLTETASQVATLSPHDAARKLASAGKPLPHVALRVIGPDGDALPAGAAGEITVRGPMVMAGYWRRPEETALALRDGWLHTGDIGYLDAEGYLYVLDRRDDLIVCGGENVYPAEVEAALLAQPAVKEAAVVGMPDTRWGHVPVAAVAVRDGFAVSEAQLRAGCASVLARYKVPARVWLVDALPRTAGGKLRRAALRDTLMQSEWLMGPSASAAADGAPAGTDI
jgi:o-succinylbenzoate---CoA ligase